MTAPVAPGIPEPLTQADPDWYRIVRGETAAAGESSAEVYVYGIIGGSWYGDGVVASTFNKEIAALEVDVLNVYVHSPGGSVYEGLAILNALRRHSARVVITIDGLAASAASFICMAGDEIVAGRNSELMIHDAWGVVLGNATELRDYAEHLDRISNNIASIYAERSGRGSRDTWREAMLAETWYSPDEALAAGLIDRVAGSDSDEDHTDAAAALRFDLSAFAHAGRSDAPDPAIPAGTRITAGTRGGTRPQLRLEPAAALPTALRAVAELPATTRATQPPAEPVDQNTNPNEKGSDMSDALMQGLRQRLGVKPDAELDEAGALAALDEALNERAGDTQTTTTQTLPDGVVAVDAEQYATLQADAQAGREAREQQLIESRNALVEAAVRDGRIAPSRREHWEASLAADPGAADVLASLKVGTVPLEPKGYTGGVDQSSDEDQAYSKVWGSDTTTTTSKEA